MPVIIYKNKLKINEEYYQKIEIAFECEYNAEQHLCLKNCEQNYFDSGDFRIKIEAAIKKFNRDILEEYERKNKGVFYLAILNYLVDEIPQIYSVNFVSETDESIYYASELEK